MEIIPVRTALPLHSLLILFWTCPFSAEKDHLPNYYHNVNVIDLLKASNINHLIKGISKVQGSKDGVQAWKFRKQVPQLILPQDVFIFLLGTTRSSLGFHFVCRQAKHTNSTLIALTSPAAMKRTDWPVLRLVSSRPSDQLRLEYQALPDMKPSYIIFPKGTAFSGSRWTQLALSLETNKAVLFVDCKEAIILEKNMFLSLFLPSDLQITVGSTKDNKADKFVGYWQTAEVSTVGYQERPWPCPGADPQPHPHLSKAAGPLRERDENKNMHMKPQSDSPYRQNEDQESLVQIPEFTWPSCTWEGREVKEGTHWESEQQTSCMCMNGRVTCTPPGCSYEGTTYNNGEPFSPDPCLSCACENQCVQCQKVSCPYQSCLNQYVPPGQCCPICRPDCEYEETIYKNGDIFLSRSNPCMNCTCTNSLVRCTPVRCPPTTNCRNPIWRPGQCCPTCTACDVNARVHNVSFVTVDGCQKCTCATGGVSCTDIYSCPQRCEHGLRHPLSPCCQDCTNCRYHGQVVFEGASFQDNQDPCQQCICTRGNVVCKKPPCAPLDCDEIEHVPSECCPRCRDPCTSVACAAVTCSNPYVPLGECCPRCPGCVVGGQRHEEGSVWVSEGQPCVSCTCENGKTRCDSQLCPPVPCQNLCRGDDECFVKCNDCSYKKHTYNNGDSFLDPDDPSMSCICQAGTVQCVSTGCASVTCPLPPIPPAECAPMCPDVCSSQQHCCYKQRIYNHGETFVHPDDPCKTCTCQAGSVLCRLPSCPQVTCPRPHTPPGECCPRCPDDDSSTPELLCDYKQHIYSGGDRFEDPDDPCKACICQDGQVTCRSPLCASVPCRNPHTPPGECCPRCSGCVVDGQWHEEGSLWVPEDQPCISCTCVNWETRCEPQPCPAVPCQNPCRQDDGCCLTCNCCSYKQHVYNNEESFIDPDDPCLMCSCQAGTVRCQSTGCAPVTCPSPHMPPGECCPRCSDCSFENHVFSDGERFRHPSNSCQQCMCLRGQVTCQYQECPPASCNNPRPGLCCRNDCNGCSFAGVEYLNGMQFSHPMDDCRSCRCYNGNIQCLKKRCPPPQCNQPCWISGRCCPQCPGCLFNNVTLADGQSVLDPRDPCSKCTCRDGRVSCTPVQCPQVQCQNPVSQAGECCPVCPRTCHFHDQVYENGAVFTIPTAQDKQCSCLDGVVSCHRMPLPLAHSCVHKDSVYTHQQTFTIRGWPTSNSCMVCTCWVGRIHCVDVFCPKLNCEDQVQDPEACCPRCREGRRGDNI